MFFSEIHLICRDFLPILIGMCFPNASCHILNKRKKLNFTFKNLRFPRKSIFYTHQDYKNFFADNNSFQPIVFLTALYFEKRRNLRKRFFSLMSQFCCKFACFKNPLHHFFFSHKKTNGHGHSNSK